MLNIKFKTDIDLMARLMILKNKMPTEFANYLWDKYRLSYIYLQKDFKSDEIDNNIVKELQQQKFFKQLCEGANKNLERIEDNWQKNKSKINLFLDNILKKILL